MIHLYENDNDGNDLCAAGVFSILSSLCNEQIFHRWKYSMRFSERKCPSMKNYQRTTLKEMIYAEKLMTAR